MPLRHNETFIPQVAVQETATNHSAPHWSPIKVLRRRGAQGKSASSTSALTFHCVLHVQGEQVPHNLSADFAHIQLLWKPGGMKWKFQLESRPVPPPPPLLSPRALSSGRRPDLQQATDVQEDMLAESHYQIIPHLPSIIPKTG